MAAAALFLGANAFLDHAARFGNPDGNCRAPTAAKAQSALERLTLQMESGDVAAADAAMPAARTAAQQAARCAPTASETWLVLARLEALGDGVTPRVSRLVMLSCRTAPTQSWTAGDRLRMFGSISGGLDEAARTCIENDRRLVALAEDIRTR